MSVPTLQTLSMAHYLSAQPQLEILVQSRLKSGYILLRATIRWEPALNYVKGEATLPCIGDFLSCSLQSLRSLLTKKQWTLVGVIVDHHHKPL